MHALLLAAVVCLRPPFGIAGSAPADVLPCGPGAELPLVGAMHVLRPGPVTGEAPSLPPALAAAESARYRIDWGVFSGIGEVLLEIRDEHVDGGRRLVRAGGTGKGGVLGLGQAEKSVETEFDWGRLAPRRFRTDKRANGRNTHTEIDQEAELINLVNRVDDGSPGMGRFTLAEPAVDPLSLLLRLRINPPAPGARQVHLVLDGPIMWRITLDGKGAETIGDGAGIRTVRLGGLAEPVHYDNTLTTDRPTRTFTLWLADDPALPAHLPLRLAAPVGPADVTALLVEWHRTPRPVAPAPPRRPTLVRPVVLTSAPFVP